MYISRTLVLAALSFLVLAVVLAGTFGVSASVSAHAGYTGDVTCDDHVNSIDSSVILQYAAGLTSTLACRDDGDVNNDTRINSLDAALILQYSAGLISSLD